MAVIKVVGIIKKLYMLLERWESYRNELLSLVNEINTELNSLQPNDENLFNLLTNGATDITQAKQLLTELLNVLQTADKSADRDLYLNIKKILES